MSIEMTARERGLIEKYGFNVTTAGPAYVVRDPKLKKRKHEGGNLEALIYRAIDEREELEKATATPKAKAARKGKQSSGTAAAKPEETTPASSPAKGEEGDKDQSKGTQSGKQATAAEKPKRTRQTDSPENWTTGKVGLLILRNPGKTPQEIMALCENDGIETKLMTVIGLTRYFRLCVTLLAIIAEKGE